MPQISENEPSVLAPSVQHHHPLDKCLPTTLSRSYSILGIATDAWVQIFADRIVVGVTQRNQRVGNWCLCQASQSATDPKAIEFQFSTVLGDRNDAMVGVYARRITERVIQLRLIRGAHSCHHMEVLLGISLQDQGKDPELFRLIVDTLVELIRDAMAVL